MTLRLLGLATLVTFTLTGPVAARDIASPNPDWEWREQSQRLHAGAADARASAYRSTPKSTRPQQRPGRYEDMRERALRGHDY